MMGFFFTHRNGNQQMEMCPFARQGLTGNAVGLMREKHERVEGVFVPDF
jgi:hypothetical protein